MTKAILSLIIIALAFGVFWTLDRIKINREIKSSKKELEIANVYLQLLEFKLGFILQVQENIFRDTPYIRKYITKNLEIFLKGDNQLNWDNIHPVEARGKRAENLMSKFKQEIELADECVKKELLEFLEISDKIAQIKRPIFYKYIGFKKNTQIRILDILIVICKCIISFYDVCSKLSSKVKKYINVSSSLFSKSIKPFQEILSEGRYVKVLDEMRGITTR